MVKDSEVRRSGILATIAAVAGIIGGLVALILFSLESKANLEKIDTNAATIQADVRRIRDATDQQGIILQNILQELQTDSEGG